MHFLARWRAASRQRCSRASARSTRISSICKSRACAVLLRPALRPLRHRAPSHRAGRRSAARRRSRMPRRDLAISISSACARLSVWTSSRFASRLARSSAGVPISRISPRCISATRWQRSASSRYGVATTIVRPSARDAPAYPRIRGARPDRRRSSAHPAAAPAAAAPARRPAPASASCRRSAGPPAGR